MIFTILVIIMILELVCQWVDEAEPRNPGRMRLAAEVRLYL